MMVHRAQLALHKTTRRMERVICLFGLLYVVKLCCGGCGQCNFNLVTGPYGVSDNAITASSTHPHCPLRNARFNTSVSWCPLHGGVGHYLQVEFQAISSLSAIQTLGRGNYNQWVTSYSVNISMDGVTWSSLSNSTTGEVKVFPGNFDRSTTVTNNLEKNIVAKYIRVISVTKHSHGSMRLEVQGCPVVNLSSTCHKWEAKLGSSDDFYLVLVDTAGSNQGQCGLKCYRLSDCDSFLFDTSSSRCRLLKSTTEQSNITLDLNGIWYFMEKG